MLFLRKYGVIFHAFFLFSKSQGKKKPRKIFLHRGRKEILCDYQEKKSTPFDSHKYFGNLLDISKFFTFNIRYYNKTSSVVYIRLILKVVGTLPFAVGRSLCRNCPPDPTLNKLFCGARRAAPPLKLFKNPRVSLNSAAGDFFFWGFDSLSGF